MHVTASFPTPQGSMIDETAARLNSHEAICAFRYDQINARLKRLESILIASAGVLICSMGGILWSVLYLR